MHVLLDNGIPFLGQTMSYAEMIGQVFAIAVVFLAQRRTLWTWPVQLVSVALLFGVYSSAHLGGLAIRQVIVGVIAVYGWWAWVHRRDPVFGVVVRTGSWRERLVAAAVFVAGTVGFALVLDALNASWAPWPDAAIFVGTALAFTLQGDRARGVLGRLARRRRDRRAVADQVAPVLQRAGVRDLRGAGGERAVDVAEGRSAGARAHRRSGRGYGLNDAASWRKASASAGSLIGTAKALARRSSAASAWPARASARARASSA